MIQTQYLIGGQSIMSDDFRLMIGTTFLPAISPRVDSVTVSGRSGVLMPDMPTVSEAPEITVKAFAKGTSAVPLMRRFYRLCRQASTLTRIEHDTVTGLSRRMTARAVCTSCEPNGDENPWGGVQAATAVFQLPDVFWQGEQWVDKTLPAVGGTLVSGANPSAGLAWDSDAPLLNLVMRFTDVSSVRVSCAASGTDLEWSAAASVRNLYLDVPNRRAWTSDRTDAWDGGTDATAGVDWASEPLQAWPSIDSGDYLLAVEQSGTGQVACRYKQSWE